MLSNDADSVFQTSVSIESKTFCEVAVTTTPLDNQS